MKELVFQIIWKIQQERKAARREPDNVTGKDILSRINTETRSALKELEAEGRIISGDALNDNYYKTITQ